MAEKPRNRPPARSHAQQTMDRANAREQGKITPEILTNLHKAGSPDMMASILQWLMNYGGLLGLPSMNDMLGRNPQPPIQGGIVAPPTSPPLPRR